MTLIIFLQYFVEISINISNQSLQNSPCLEQPRTCLRRKPNGPLSLAAPALHFLRPKWSSVIFCKAKQQSSFLTTYIKTKISLGHRYFGASISVPGFDGPVCNAFENVVISNREGLMSSWFYFPFELIVVGVIKP